MLLGNQQLPPGTRADCYLGSSPTTSNCSACSPGTFPEPDCGADQRKATCTAVAPPLHRWNPVLLCGGAITPDLHPRGKAARPRWTPPSVGQVWGLSHAEGLQMSPQIGICMSRSKQVCEQLLPPAIAKFYQSGSRDGFTGTYRGL